MNSTRWRWYAAAVAAACCISVIGVAGAAALDLFQGDDRCEWAGSSVYGQATWSWWHLGTTCDYSEFVGWPLRESPGSARLPLALVSLLALPLAIRAALRTEPGEPSKMSAAVFGLVIAVVLVIASIGSVS